MDYFEAVSHAKKGFHVRRNAWKEDEFMTSYSPEPYLVHNRPYPAQDCEIANSNGRFVYVCEVRDVEAQDWIFVR